MPLNMNDGVFISGADTVINNCGGEGQQNACRIMLAVESDVEEQHLHHFTVTLSKYKLLTCGYFCVH